MMGIQVLTQQPAWQNCVPLLSWPREPLVPPIPWAGGAEDVCEWVRAVGRRVHGGDGAPASPPPAGFHYESNNETDKREFEKAVETIAVSFSST